MMHAAVAAAKLRTASTLEVTRNEEYETKSIDEAYCQNNHCVDFELNKFRGGEESSGEMTASMPSSPSSHHMSPVLIEDSRVHLENSEVLRDCRSRIPDMSLSSIHQESYVMENEDGSCRKISSSFPQISQQSPVSVATSGIDFRPPSNSGSFSGVGALSLKTASASMTSNSSTSSEPIISFTRSQGVFPFDDGTGGRQISSNNAPNATFMYYTVAADVNRLCNTNVTGSVPIVLSPSMFGPNNVATNHTTSVVQSTIPSSVISGTGFIDIKEHHKSSSSPSDMIVTRSSAAMSMPVNPQNRILLLDPLTIKSEPDDRTQISYDDVISRRMRLIACGENKSTYSQEKINPDKPEAHTSVVEGICAMDGMLGLATRGGSGVFGQSASTTSGKLFSCPICSRDFASEKYLSMHVSLHQQQTSGANVLEPPVTLPSSVSLSTVVNTNDQINHCSTPMLNSFQQQPFLPSVSAYQPSSLVLSSVISTSVALKVPPPPPPPIRRPKTGSGSKMGGGHWTCQICDKTFAQNSNYKNHIRTHSNERPFVCEICSIGFKERYHLKKHVLFKHTDELREECRVCGKRFKDSTAVRAHERTHSDQRPYACPRCDKTFKTSECLWHHENRSKTCGKSLGDLSLSVATVTRLPMIAVATSTDKELNKRSISSGKMTRRDRRYGTSSGVSKRKQSGSLVTMAQTPIGQAIKSEPCRLPSLIRFPIEDDQMGYTEVVIADESQHHLRNHQLEHLIQTPHINQLRQVAVSTGENQHRSPAAFVTTFDEPNSSIARHCQLVNGEVTVGMGCNGIQINSGSVAARSPMLPTHAAAPQTSAPATTSMLISRLPPGLIVNDDMWDLGDHDQQAILQHLESDDTVEHQINEHYHQNVHHHHHITQHKSHAVEVKVETDAMMELLDYNLTALNQSTDSSLFDDFNIDIGVSVDDNTDYYQKFVENNEEEENNQHSWKMEVDRSINGTMTDGITTFTHQKDPDKTKGSNSSRQMVNRQHPESSSSSVSMGQRVDGRPRPPSPRAIVGAVEQDISSTDSVVSEVSLSRPYRCDQCAVGFKLKVHLKKHNLYKHSNEYPCACGVCGKRFKDSSAVRLHERIHSTARPFECQRCGKSFKTRENLWGHRHRGPCERSCSTTRSGSPSGSSRAVLGNEADGAEDSQPVALGCGFTTCIPSEEPVENYMNRDDNYCGLQKDMDKNVLPLHGSRSRARHVFDIDSDQIVVQGSDDTKLLARAIVSTTSNACADATPNPVSLGIGTIGVATNNEFGVPIWTSSPTQHNVVSSSPSSAEGEVFSLNKKGRTTVKMDRRFFSRYPMTSGSSGIGAVVAAAAKAMSMMEGPPVSVQTWLSSNSTPTGVQPMALLPTAVVAPIKREQPDNIDLDCSSPPTADDYPCLSATSLTQHPFYDLDHAQSSTIPVVIGLEKYSLPPFETLIGVTSSRPPTEAPHSSMASCNRTSILIPSPSDFSDCSNIQQMVVSRDLQYSRCNTLSRLPGIDQLFHKPASTNSKMTIRGANLVASLNNVIELARASPSSFNGVQPPRAPHHHFNQSKLIEIVNHGNLSIWKRAQMPHGDTASTQVQFRTGEYAPRFPQVPPYQGLPNGIGNGVRTTGAISGRRFDYSESTITAATAGNRSHQLLSAVGKR